MGERSARVHQPLVHGAHAPVDGPDPEKKVLTATEQAKPHAQAHRALFNAVLAYVTLERLVFIDESGSHIGMTREWGRGPRGQRVHGTVRRNRGTATTMIGAMDLHGLRTLMTIEGATTADVFLAFVEHFLLPELHEGDVVVLDNVGAHKPHYIAERIRSVGAEVVFLPPYSPDLNPIELLWSKLKGVLKKLGARTRSALDEAIAMAMETISPDDAAGWFKHCGYVAQPN